MILRRHRAVRDNAVSKGPRKRPQQAWGRPALLACCAALLGALAGPHDAQATTVTLDTSALAGVPGRFDFDLYDYDPAASNTVTISNIVSNGVSGTANCMVIVGCTGGPASFVLSDALGFGQLLYDLTLGTSLSFDLSYTNNFGGVAGTDPADQFVVNLLDPNTNRTLVITNLTSASNALLTVDLTGAGAGLVQAAGSTTPTIGIAVVPEPGSLALTAVALLALVGRRARTACRTAVSASTAN